MLGGTMRSKSLGMLVVVGCVIVAAGCGTVKKVVKTGVNETGYMLGVTDRPEVYDPDSPDYFDENFLAGYQVEPDGKVWLARTFDMVKAWKRMPKDEPLTEKQQAVHLGRADTDDDSTVDEDEAQKYFEKFRKSLAGRTPVDVAEIDDGTPNPPRDRTSATRSRR
jgi:hypothetical protein